MINNSRIIQYIFALLSILLVLSCQNNVTDPEEEQPEDRSLASIRFIHSATSAAELDLAYLSMSDGFMYKIEDGTIYGYQYGYFNFYTGDLELRVFEPFSDVALAVGAVTMESEKRYTFIACDFEATVNPQMLVLKDSTQTAVAGKSWVRFVHAASDIDNISITQLDGSTLVASLGRLDHTDYLNLDAGTYRFVVKEEGKEPVILEVPPTTFLEQKNYTVVISGTLSDLTAIDLNARVYPETTL